MNFSFSNIAAGFIYSILGYYLVKHARKVGHVPSFVIGIALMFYTYFFDNVFLVWGIGAGLCLIAVKLLKS